MKKRILNSIIPLLYIANSFAINSINPTSIVIKNTLPVNRTNELVEIPILNITDFSNFALYNEIGNSVAYQVLPNGNIAFQATVNAQTTANYMYKNGIPATTNAKTYVAQKMQATRNDIAWENDLSAYRMYHKMLLSIQPNTANGTDVWCKKTTAPIIDKMYTYADYHTEQTEGVDAYSVNGKTLGAGGVVGYANNTLWLHDPYDSCQIISNGPLKSEFILKYNKVIIDGDYYSKSVHITTSANGLLNKAVVRFDGKLKSMKIAAGIYLHTNVSGFTPAGVQYTSESNIIGYAEKPSEGTVTSSNPRIFTGVYMPGETSYSTINNQLVIMCDYVVGTDFTYYFGSGWNIFPASKYSSDNDWFNALKQFKQLILNPLSILSSETGVVNPTSKLSSLVVFPNPSNGNNFEIPLNEGCDSSLDVRIFNSTGNTVFNRNVIADQNSLKFNHLNLSAGCYLISVSSGSFIKSSKFTVN